MCAMLYNLRRSVITGAVIRMCLFPSNIQCITLLALTRTSHHNLYSGGNKAAVKTRLKFTYNGIKTCLYRISYYICQNGSSRESSTKINLHYSHWGDPSHCTLQIPLTISLLVEMMLTNSRIRESRDHVTSFVNLFSEFNPT